MRKLTEEQRAARRQYAREYYRKYFPLNADRVRAKRREYANRPEVKAKRAARIAARKSKPGNYLATRTYNRQRKLRAKFGLTPEQYEEMLSKQNGVCAICEQPETGKVRGITKPLAVDHDHATGKVRGLLCDRCNHALGRMQDQPARLRRAADYLEQHQELQKCS